MEADFPTERWFWFDPPFHPEQSALLHRQADNVWRIDFQLGWDANPEQEREPERVAARIQAMLGPARAFTLEWISVYTFHCRRMDRFRHGRVIFAGDAAHQASPFGARGANGGIQDVDNLTWKLARVLSGKAPESLLDTYDMERVPAADENIMNSTRSTDFITPKSRVSRMFRDAALQLAEHAPFARRLVNSGRLSTPHSYAKTPLNTPDQDAFGGRAVPGAPADDAPLVTGDEPAWLLDQLGGRFVGIYFAGAESANPNLRSRLTALSNLPGSGRSAGDLRGGPVGELESAGVGCVRRFAGVVRSALRCDARRLLSDPARSARCRALAPPRHPSRARCRAAGNGSSRAGVRSVAGLNIELNLASPDDFYAALVELHRGLSDEQSELVNARLILLLSNHVGDIEVLREAMRRAREGIEGA